MHKSLKRSISILLSVLLIAAMMPCSTMPVFAADDEFALSSIGSADHVSSVVISDFTVTLKLDYGYTDSIDLDSLDYTWRSAYDIVDTDFSDSSIAAGESSDMTVTYQYSSGDDSTHYVSTYTIRAVAGTKPAFSGTISKSVAFPSDITFDDSDFTAKYTQNDGEALDYITIEGSPTSAGTLMLNSSEYILGDAISVSDLDSGRLQFDSLATGTATFSVKAYADDSDSTYCGSATLSITVNAPSASTITYTTSEDTNKRFNDTDFISACTGAVGGTFKNMKLSALPSTSAGKLYIDYVSASNVGTKVAANTLYNAASIDKITFVPYAGYSGTVTLNYTGYNTNDTSYTGQIKIVVEESETDAATISLTTDEDVPVKFSGSKFDDVCDDTTNEDLDYVKFTLPSSTYGVLYYKYVSSSSPGTKVSATTKYDVTGISNITFVPKTGYSGTVTINYTGYNEDGDKYTGQVKITVKEDSSDVDAVTYSGASGEAITFDGDDFVDVFDDEFSREEFEELKFTLPSSTYGTLYSKYTSATSPGTKVSATTKYDEADLDKISFVSKSTYSGTVVINYTGYYDNGAETYTGKIRITVGSSTSSDVISLTTKEETPITFNEEKFNDVCEDETDEELDYVKFTLPITTQGKLYYNYTSATNYSSVVSASTKYYYDDTPSISKVTFVPYKDFYGAVTIKYTGYNVDGESFSGSVKITVTDVAETNVASAYFTDVTTDYAWAAPSIDALYKASIVTGTSTGKYSPASNIIRGDFMLMLYRALGLKATTSGSFADVPSGSYYYTAITVAKALNIAQGSGGYFYPTTPITREDAMVLVARALKADGQALATGSTSDLAGFSDRNSVSDYAISSVGALVKAGVIKGNNSNLYPKSPVTRAEMAVILYRVTQL